MYQNGENIPNDHTIYQMVTKQPFARPFARPYKIPPNWDFWFENIPLATLK
jgi:hypothetical protein